MLTELASEQFPPSSSFSKQDHSDSSELLSEAGEGPSLCGSLRLPDVFDDLFSVLGKGLSCPMATDGFVPC